MKGIDVNKVVEILNANIENAEIASDKFDANLTELGMESIAFIQIIVAM